MKFLADYFSLKAKGRIILGIGVVLLGLRLAMAFSNHDFSLKEANFAATCLRTGIFCTVLGLAWDTIIKIPVWLWIAIPLIGAILIFWPRQGLFLIPLLFAYLAARRWIGKHK